MAAPTAPTATPAPAVAMPTFINAVYPSQVIELPGLTDDHDKRKLPLNRQIKFVPQKVGERDEGERRVPIIHGFYTPRDEAELAALRAVCARGYCLATEEDAEVRRARETMQRVLAEQEARRSQQAIMAASR